MFSIRKTIAMLLCFTCLIFSCRLSQEKNKQEKATNSNFVEELNEEQQAAFDALNTLQLTTDVKNKLYSTFADIEQPYYPPDTSFVISQSELLAAMKQFVKENCTKLTVEKQEKLATSAVLAQKEYSVLYSRNHLANINYGKEIPKEGVWILPNVLGRRDVILVW